MASESAKLAAAIAQVDMLAADLDDNDPKAQALRNLIDHAQRNQRRLDRLIKRSDATEEKLVEANRSLETITTNMARFVPQTVVDALTQGGAEQVAETTRRNLTVFFSDIVGFSTMASRQEPETLAQLLMEYFTAMSAICAKYGGTLDQFIGDAIVIFFGDPVSKGVKGDAVAAVEMALEMQARMDELRIKWNAEGLVQDLHVRMGISTGYCNVGNFGSAERMHYTAIGNAVNEASRLETLAAPDTVVISADTNALIEGKIDTVSIGEMVLKGRDHPV
ncbi:MAG: adenylate/guanylate cyclase domain-containing protein, partial [Alphaproteobacteria bacterium]|nr:adenylate/guanylate cyclase domain-containing protein [Alphaproteobacteria bacterium]